MGLAVGIGFLAAAGGSAFAALCFREAQNLRRLFNRPYAAAFFYILAAAGAVFAATGVLLGAAVIRAYWF